MTTEAQVNQAEINAQEELQKARNAEEYSKKQRLAGNPSDLLEKEMFERRSRVKDEEDNEEDNLAYIPVAPQMTQNPTVAQKNTPPKQQSAAPVNQAPASRDDMLAQIRNRDAIKLRSVSESPKKEEVKKDDNLLDNIKQRMNIELSKAIENNDNDDNDDDWDLEVSTTKKVVAEVKAKPEPVAVVNKPVEVTAQPAEPKVPEAVVKAEAVNVEAAVKAEVSSPAPTATQKQQPAQPIKTTIKAASKVASLRSNLEKGGAHVYNQAGGNWVPTSGNTRRPVAAPASSVSQNKQPTVKAQAPVSPAKVIEPAIVKENREAALQADLIREQTRKAQEEETARRIAEQAELARQQQEKAEQDALDREAALRLQAELNPKPRHDLNQEFRDKMFAARLQIEEETGEIELPENLSAATLFRVANDVAGRAEKQLGFRQPKPEPKPSQTAVERPLELNRSKEDPAQMYVVGFMIGFYVETNSVVMTALALASLATQIQALLLLTAAMERRNNLFFSPHAPLMNRHAELTTQKDFREEVSVNVEINVTSRFTTRR